MTDIMIFETDNQQIEVRLQGNTLWVSQSQMAELFSTSVDNISLHLKNVIKRESWKKVQLPRISR